MSTDNFDIKVKFDVPMPWPGWKTLSCTSIILHDWPTNNTKYVSIFFIYVQRNSLNLKAAVVSH